jgi:hypothetical protein
MSQLEHATAQHERCLARIAAIIADNARKLSRHDRAELVDLLVTAGSSPRPSSISRGSRSRRTASRTPGSRPPSVGT